MATTIKCEQCGHEQEISLGKLVAQNRWKGTTKEQRKKAMSDLAKGNTNRADHAKRIKK